MTGIGCGTRVYTDRAIFEVGAAGARVVETFGVTLDALRGLTGLDLERKWRLGTPW